MQLAGSGQEFAIGADSRIDHCKLQHESLNAYHVAAMSVARTLVMRLEGLWAAVTVIWRGGPLLFGAYALVGAVPAVVVGLRLIQRNRAEATAVHA